MNTNEKKCTITESEFKVLAEREREKERREREEGRRRKRYRGRWGVIRKEGLRFNSQNYNGILWQHLAIGSDYHFSDILPKFFSYTLQNLYSHLHK